MPIRPLSAGQVALACLFAAGTLSPALAQGYAPAGPVRAAVVEVHLPAAAELWFDGMATTLRGEQRAFNTPPLRAGLTYRYEVQVRWREGGQDVVRSERVLIRAGEAVLVDFTQPRRDEGRPDHMAVRDIAIPPAAARVVSAAHDSLVGLSARTASSRRLPGYMAINEVNPPADGGRTARYGPVPPAYMSIVEFDTPRQ